MCIRDRIYIEERINALYRTSGLVSENKNIERSDLLDILDSVPNSLLSLMSPEVVKKEAKAIQTEHNPNERRDSNIHKPMEGKMRKRGRSVIMKPGNALARAINKSLSQKKEKASAMTETNAYKLIGIPSPNL